MATGVDHHAVISGFGERGLFLPMGHDLPYYLKMKKPGREPSPFEPGAADGGWGATGKADA
jgi:hypothetical protein